MNSEKIGAQHLARKAVLYVRQSSAHQVLHNRESRALQYAMRGRLTQLGWSEIDIVDEDLGRSAAGGVTRSGFERMVAEVCLGKVGAVAAREVSRFARNSHDWQQLVEMCRVVDTLLIDQETVYAPRLGNDRLLLGLKGSLNEYELDLLRQRSLAANHCLRNRLKVVIMRRFLRDLSADEVFRCLGLFRGPLSIMDKTWGLIGAIHQRYRPLKSLPDMDS